MYVCVCWNEAVRVACPRSCYHVCGGRFAVNGGDRRTTKFHFCFSDLTRQGCQAGWSAEGATHKETQY